MKIYSQFVKSAVDAKHYPDVLHHGAVPEVAFLGRSNVGKSSLLNSLVGEKMANVSSTPGRTQTINFFNIFTSKPTPDTPAELVFADLPGYGYAKAPKAIVGEWPKFIEPYLIEREPLKLCVCLVDSNIPPQSSDLNLVEWLRSHGREIVLVATKTDKLGGNKLRNQLRLLNDAFDVNLLPYSAKTKVGHKDLWQVIRSVSEMG
jgi:GTP-binding protein